MKKIKFVILAILMTVLISCSNSSKELSFMSELKESISEKYDIENIELKVNERSNLTVKIKDSKFENYDVEKKIRISRAIGQMVKNLREEHVPIKSGTVQFVAEGNYGIFKTSESEDFKMFQ